MTKEERFEKNQNLVFYVFNKYFQNKMKFKEDLLQCGNLGLWKACLNYNEKLGIKFSTFAFFCIKNEMTYFLRNEKKMLNIIGLEDIVEQPSVSYSEPFSLPATLTAREKKYAEMLMEAKTKAECRKHFKFSNTTMAKMRKNMQTKFNDFLKQ